MNIAIDICGMLAKSKNRGIGNYIKGLLQSLFIMDPENRYFLFNPCEDISLKDIWKYGENVSIHNFSFGKDLYALSNDDYNPLFGNVVKRFIRENSIDLFCVPSPFECAVYHSEWFLETKYAVIVHDLIPLIFSNIYLTHRVKKERYDDCLNFVCSADIVFTNSQCTKDDLIKYTKINAKKIYVIYAGVNENFQPKQVEERIRQELYNKYGINRRFILLLGADDKRKNMERQIEAYSKLSQSLKDEFELVIICAINKSKMEDYKDLVSKYNVSDSVIFTNFVPQEDLLLFYNTAEVFMLVSMYEGFGLPVLEAMKCGLPVLASNNSSLIEIAEGAAVLADPFDTADITRRIEEILTETDLDALKHIGFERAKEFSWERSAKLMLMAIKQLPVSTKEKRKMKIAFFTSLPPIKSDISDYNADILWELANTYDIDVFIDDGYESDCILPINVNIFNHTVFGKCAANYERYLFHMGNNKYHLYMYPYIKKYGGIVVLHDVNLQETIRGYSILPNSSNFRKYAEYLAYDYDKDTIAEIITATFNWDRSIIYKYPINGFVTSYASNIIVHSNYAKAAIEEMHNNYRVTVIPLYSKADLSEAVEMKSQARKTLGISEERTIILSFGFRHSRRTFQILKALPRILSKNKNIDCYFIGYASEDIISPVLDYIRSLGLSERIYVQANAGTEMYLSYIDASDICVNLRYPYNGESSAVQSKLLYKGKCSLVTDIGSFSEIPDDCCVKIPSPENTAEEADIIKKSLLDLIERPDKVKEIGCRARKFAQSQLDVHIAAKKYIDVINNADCNIYTDEYLDYLRDSFAQYMPNKTEIDSFNKTILYAAGK